MAKRKTPQEGVSVAEIEAHHADEDDSPPKLTYKQRQFCEFYIDNKGNGTRAYIASYGCTELAARTGASVLLTNPNVQKYLRSRRAQIEEMFSCGRDKWLRVLVAQAFTRDEDVREALASGEPLGDLAYGADCKASDRKAALDELRDVLGYKTGADKKHGESVVGGVLQKLRKAVQ